MDYRVIDGKRVRVADFIDETRKKGTVRRLDAPYGYKKTTVTPWGAREECTIVVMQGPGTSLDRMATVNRPHSNPGVAFSVFRVD